ncbi:uncharacterized protein FA14DRAFT_162886, partial [Meira miltonrushii]
MARSIHRAQSSHVIRRPNVSESFEKLPPSPSDLTKVSVLKESSLNQERNGQSLKKVPAFDPEHRISPPDRLESPADASTMNKRTSQKSPFRSRGSNIPRNVNGNGKKVSPKKNIAYMPGDGIQRDTSAEILASLSNSSRLKWTPGSKSFSVVERTGESSYEGMDDEAHTRDRIILLPTKRARDLSRFHPRPSTSSIIPPPVHGEMDISILDDDDFNRGPTPPIEYESDLQIENSAPAIQQISTNSPKPAVQSPQKKGKSPRKTMLTPVKDRFVPTSSPLAKQIDDEESQLMDAEWNANDDMVLMTPLPAKATRKGTPTNSSMVLTSPFHGSERDTSSVSPSKSLRDLLESYYEKVGRGTSANSRSIRSNHTIQDLSQEPTPTRPLRNVSGHISTPHPYRLHTLNELQEEQAATAEEATPNAQRSLEQPSVTPDALQSNASRLYERDLSTILAENVPSSDHDADFTFDREADIQERAAEKHVPQYRKSIGNIFDRMQQGSSTGGHDRNQGTIIRHTSSSPIVERVSSSPLKQVSSANHNDNEVEQDDQDGQEEEDEDEDNLEYEQDVEDPDDERELNNLREWSRQDAGAQAAEESDANDVGDDWHASARYEAQSEEEEYDEENLDEEEEDFEDEEEEENFEDEEEEVDLEDESQDEAEHYEESVDEEVQRQENFGTRARRTDSNVASEEGEESHAEANSVTMRESDETMVLANMMRQRMEMLDSRPDMVELSSKNYDAAARAAEVLRAYHNYVQHGLLEADFDMDTCTITDLDESQRERSITANSGMNRSSTLRSAEKGRTPRLSRRSGERHSIMDTAHSPAKPATPHSSASITASTPLVPGAFPGSSNRHARRSGHLQDDRERQRKQNVTSGTPDLTKFSNADFRRLIDFVDAKIVAHANNLREEREIGKGEAYLSGLKSLDQSDIVIEFLEENEIFDHAQLHEWSKKLMKKRITVLLMRLIEKLQGTYPDLDVNAMTIESVAEEEDATSPATPLRQNSTIDESGIAKTVERVPFRMINASTPARPSSHLKEVTFADSLERGPQSIYPALPREHRKRNPSAMDETETTEDNIRADTASTSIADATKSWTRQGLSMFGSFIDGVLSRGKNQSQQSLTSVHDPVEEQIESDEI